MEHWEEESALLTLTRLKKPARYGVVLLNDNVTTMDFVVMVLKRVFWHPEEEAKRLMLTIHHEGRATCGVYSLDVAQTKADQVRTLARENRFPLQCLLEKEE